MFLLSLYLYIDFLRAHECGWDAYAIDKHHCNKENKTKRRKKLQEIFVHGFWGGPKMHQFLTKSKKEGAFDCGVHSSKLGHLASFSLPWLKIDSASWYVFFYCCFALFFCVFFRLFLFEMDFTVCVFHFFFKSKRDFYSNALMLNHLKIYKKEREKKHDSKKDGTNKNHFCVFFSLSRWNECMCFCVSVMISLLMLLLCSMLCFFLLLQLYARVFGSFFFVIIIWCDDLCLCFTWFCAFFCQRLSTVQCRYTFCFSFIFILWLNVCCCCFFASFWFTLYWIYLCYLSSLWRRW